MVAYRHPALADLPGPQQGRGRLVVGDHLHPAVVLQPQGQGVVAQLLVHSEAVKGVQHAGHDAQAVILPVLPASVHDAQLVADDAQIAVHRGHAQKARVAALIYPVQQRHRALALQGGQRGIAHEHRIIAGKRVRAQAVRFPVAQPHFRQGIPHGGQQGTFLLLTQQQHVKAAGLLGLSRRRQRFQPKGTRVQGQPALGNDQGKPQHQA